MRISKDEYYLLIAKAVSKRSPCLKRQIGAIIVKDDSIVSTGYNGPPRGEPHCKICPRIDKPHGSSYTEECPAVHAEENCIINAARNGVSVRGGALYLYDGKPCYRCRRLLKNAGVYIYE